MKKLLLCLGAAAFAAAQGMAYDFNYTLDTANMTAEIVAAEDVVNPYQGEVIIPEQLTVDGLAYTVTSIGYRAFFNTHVTSVTLPSTIKSIKQGAFGFNSFLASVTLNDGLEEMAWDAFASTPNLKTITIPGSLKTVPFNAFGRSGLESLTVSEGVETIEAAFTDCSNLASVSLPETLKKLDGTFENCAALTSIALPSSLREIGWFTFAGTGIETLEIPEGIEMLDMQSLGMMNGDHNRDYILKKVVFPASLKTVYGKTLNNRCGITELTFNGDGSAITVNDTYTDFLAKTALETLFLNRTFTNAAGADVTSEVIGNKSTLKNITFGGAMTATPALTGCTAISNITVLNPVPPTAGEFAPEVYANATLTVPAGTSAAYRTADVWKNFAHITDGSPVSAINPAKIRYTVGTGDNLSLVSLHFANDRRLDNFVWGFRSADNATEPSAIIDAIAAADKRLYVTKNAEGAITSVAVDLNNDGEIDARDISAEGEWTAEANAMSSDELTPVVSLTNGADILEAPYYFYMPDPETEGVFIPEAMTVKLSDEGFVLPVLVQTPGGKLNSTSNWQASSSNTSYRLDRTKITTPYTLVDDTYNAVPTFVGTTGTTYVRYRPQKVGEYAYYESNYMTLTIEAPEVPMTSITASVDEVESGLNKVIPFEYTYEPENATFTAVKVTSGNTQVATWSASAGLKATTKAGTAVVTIASAYDSEVKDEFTVTTRLMSPVTNVTFGHATEEGVINVPVRQLVDLRPIVEPADADIPGVTITLSDNGTSKDDMTCSTYKVNWWDVNNVRSQFLELSGHRPTGDHPAKLLVKSDDGAFEREFTVNVIEADRTPLENGYTEGTIILNEEWFGHTNGGLNYVTEDDELIYQAYERENPGMSFGATSQFGGIWAGKLIVVSKQAKDGGDPLPGGGRLVIADAKTLKRLGSLDNLEYDGKSGDGRAMAGATPDKIYVGSSNGIYIVDISDPASPVITGRISSGEDSADLYNGQTGDMINAGKYVFAVMQNKGILAIDTRTDEATLIADANVQGVTQTADGTVWFATLLTNNETASVFVGLNPETLEETSRVTMPASIGTVVCGWGAWRSTAFKGSYLSNDLWFVTGAAGIMGGASGDYYRYHVGDNPEGIQPFFTLSNVTGINGFGEEVGQMTYGTPVFDDRNNRLVVMAGRKGAASGGYRDHWLHFVDGDSKEITKTFHLDPYYWFQSLPIIPDKHDAEINVEDITLDIADGQTEIDLATLVTDRDNIDANIRLSLLDTPVVAEENESQTICADAALDGRKLTVIPHIMGTRQLTIAAESNGRAVTKTINLTVTDQATGIGETEAAGGSISCDGHRVYFRGLDTVKFAVYDTNGREITRFIVDGDYFVAGFSVADGVYILRGSNGSNAKCILRK